MTFQQLSPQQRVQVLQVLHMQHVQASQQPSLMAQLIPQQMQQYQAMAHPQQMPPQQALQGAAQGGAMGMPQDPRQQPFNIDTPHQYAIGNNMTGAGVGYGNGNYGGGISLGGYGLRGGFNTQQPSMGFELSQPNGPSTYGYYSPNPQVMQTYQNNLQRQQQ